MDLYFKPVTSENREQVEALKTAPGQEGFIESVSECMKEADKRKCWRPVGIYDGSKLVGFAMYGFFWEYLPFGRVWMDRLLIDQNHQGKGYGKEALIKLLEQLHKEYRRKKIYLSVYPSNKQAIRLYQQLGFRFNGQHDTHGEEVMVYMFPDHY